MRWMTALCLILVIAAANTPASADKDGSTIWGEDRRSTLRAMKKVQRALGVKSCLHCHVKKDGRMDYEIETAHKGIARQMFFAFTDTLVSAGAASVVIPHHGKTVRIAAVRKTKGEDAGIHLTVVVPAEKEGESARTVTARVDLPGKDQTIECNTCHAGKLHFVTGG
jgi:hypothetical protein